MGSQYYVAGTVPERFVEVDAARLLLIIARFARQPETQSSLPRCRPAHPFVAYFTPEYYLHKLDFLLRYPRYFVYELTELFRMGVIAVPQRDEVLQVVRTVIADNEPELMTQHFRRFWRGAYERLDLVESFWHARQLIYIAYEPRGEARPWKYYFLTQQGHDEAERLVAEVAHARWYADRLALIHRYFGGITAAKVKELQYSHAGYRAAQLGEYIPDLTSEEIGDNFTRVFGESLMLEVSA